MKHLSGAVAEDFRIWIGSSTCSWGDEKTFISVQYAGDKVLLFSGQGLK